MASTWRDALRDSVANIDNFAAHCKKLAGTKKGWAHADAPALVGLEAWGTALAQKDRTTGIAALVTAARAGFPAVMKAGGTALDNMGMTGTKIVDGGSCELQIDRAAAWLDDPKALSKVKEALDPTRQLYVWDDDLRPPDKASFYWYLDVGQCCSAAILNDGKGTQKLDAKGPGYYEWPSANVVGRGLVAVARGLRAKAGSGDIDRILAMLHAAFASAGESAKTAKTARTPKKPKKPKKPAKRTPAAKTKTKTKKAR